QVVVALCPDGIRDHLELAMVRHEFDHWLFECARREGLELLLADPFRMDLLKCLVEPSQVVATKRRDDVDAAREFLGSLENAGEAADHHVLHSPPVKRLENAVRIELRAPLSHARSSSQARSGAGEPVAPARDGGSCRAARRGRYLAWQAR